MATEKQVNYIMTLDGRLGLPETAYALRFAIGHKLTTVDQVKEFYIGKKLNAEKISGLTIDEASKFISYLQTN